MKLEQPVSFPLFVEGIRMRATVVEDNTKEEEQLYRVLFSDGFDDIFSYRKGLVQCRDKKLSSAYAKAIRNDLGNVANPAPGQFVYIFSEFIHGVATNMGD